MSSENTKWKEGLLSSNMPLELEAGGILASKGFTVGSEYKYKSASSDSIASVALHAFGHTPFSDTNEMTTRLELPVMCGHRPQDSLWVFMPDPNPPESSPAASRGVIRAVDSFSPWAFDPEVSVELEKAPPVCLKGIEINETTGDVDADVVRRGIARLQGVLPRIFTENVLFFFTGRPDENIPFIYCPVLLTTAQLFVLEKNSSPEQIENASNIRDAASEAPYLALHSSYDPNFETECARECARLEVLYKSDKAALIEQRKARHHENRELLPFTIIDSLTGRNHAYLDYYFNRFIICSQKHFSNFMDDIKRAVESAAGARKAV